MDSAGSAESSNPGAWGTLGSGTIPEALEVSVVLVLVLVLAAELSNGKGWKTMMYCAQAQHGLHEPLFRQWSSQSG